MYMTHTHTHTTQVEVEHSYSLSNVEKLFYDDATLFHLSFPTFTTVLQAETAEEAKDWVEKIKTGEPRMT